MASQPKLPDFDFASKHFRVRELAESWELSDDTVRKVFEAEPGVLHIGSEHSTGHKRRYCSLRIPASVAERVYRRLMATGKSAK
jgi:hypothetical protein